MDVDTVFRARTVITAPGGPTAEFAAARAGRLVAVGPAAEAEGFARAGVPLVDFGPATLLPGWWDSHVHLLSTGLTLRETDLGAAQTLAEVFDLVRKAAARGQDLALCARLDESRLAERRLPTGAELDAAAPRAPVAAIRVDCHSLVLNTAAWRYLGVEASWPGVDREASGKPTGLLRGRANELARRRIHERLPAAVKRRAFEEAAAHAAARGVVALAALEGGQLFGADDLRLLLGCAEALPVDVFVYPQLASVAEVRALGLPRLGGCLLVDGSLGSQTAALSEPYADRPTSRGELYFADDDLAALVLTAHAAGLQIALHAIGDRAVGQVLDAYGLAQAEHPRPECRHRLEHAELVADGDFARAAELGVVFSMQPAFEWFWGGEDRMYASRLGARRHLTNRLRTPLRHGLTLAGGSDSPITPLDPRLGIAAALNHPTAGERLSFPEALALFTTGAATAVFAEDDYGTLAPGKWASFTVLARDPRELAPKEIASAEVVATVRRGEITYKRDDESA
jgi:predicted amidohydrolase YtcJ